MDKIICKSIGAFISLIIVVYYFVSQNELALFGTKIDGVISEIAFTEIEEADPIDGYFHYSGYNLTYTFSVEGANYSNEVFLNSKALGVLQNESFSNYNSSEIVDLLEGKVVYVKYLAKDPKVNNLAFLSEYKFSIWQIVICGVIFYFLFNFISGLLFFVFKID